MSRTQSVVGKGEITDYVISSPSPREVSTLCITMKVSEWLAVPYRSESTAVVALPYCDTFARVRGTRKFNLYSTVGNEQIEVTLVLLGLYPTYEEAVVEEMKNKMENAK